MGTGKKIVIGMIVFFLLAAGGLYGVGVYFFSSRFLPNSSVNGLDVSYKTADSVQEHMADEIAAYTPPLFSAVKNEDTNILKPASKNDQENTLKACRVISASSRPGLCLSR